MKIASIVGARPQFIKCAPVSRRVRRQHVEILIHTGQHYDRELSQIFFDQLDIPRPDYELGVGSAPHGEQTAKMLAGIETVLLKEKPQVALVYGDTNSTLAGALAAAKIHIPVVHVEAGLRSFNRRMPEEINRILADRVSALLFCPTETAVENLSREGIVQGVHNTGDVMYDSVLYHTVRAEKISNVLQRLHLPPAGYYLATAHRAENTDRPENLSGIISTLGELDLPVIFPIHPRTRQALKTYGLRLAAGSSLRLIDPVGYVDMLVLEKNACKILTDSGGMQKEAFFFQIPCITMREETEWVETLEGGWNTLTGVDPEAIRRALLAPQPEVPPSAPFGDGRAAEKMASLLESL